MDTPSLCLINHDVAQNAVSEMRGCSIQNQACSSHFVSSVTRPATALDILLSQMQLQMALPGTHPN